MFGTFAILFGVIFGAACLVGGVTTAIRNARNNKAQSKEETKSKETVDTDTLEKKNDLEKTVDLEEENVLNPDEKIEKKKNDAPVNEKIIEKPVTKDKWLEKNDISQEKLNSLIDGKVENLVKEGKVVDNADCKQLINAIISQQWNKVISKVSKEGETLDLNKLVDVEEFIDTKTTNTIVNTSKKYEAYTDMVNKVKKLNDEDNPVNEETNKQLQNIFDNLRRRIAINLESLEKYELELDNKYTDIQGKIITNSDIQKVLEKTEKTADNLKILDEIVESHSYDLKMLGYLELSNIKGELDKLRNDLNSTDEKLNNKIDSAEKLIKSAMMNRFKVVAKELKKLKKETDDLTWNDEQIEDWIKEATKAFEGKASKGEVSKLIKAVDSLVKKVEKNDKENLVKKELEEMKKALEEVNKKITNVAKTKVNSSKFTAEIKKLKEAIEEAKKDNINLEELNEIKKSVADLDGYIKKHVENDDIHASLKADLDKMKQELADQVSAIVMSKFEKDGVKLSESDLKSIRTSVRNTVKKQLQENPSLFIDEKLISMICDSVKLAPSRKNGK